jgi:hypothetical protein
MAETAGIGAKFAYGNTGAAFTALTTGWTLVGEVTDVTTPEPEADGIETTHHDVTDKHRLYQGGLIDGGEAEVTTHYDKTVYATLAALIGTDKAFRIAFSDGSAVGFNGFLKSHGTEIDMEGLTLMKFKVKVSGAITTVASMT